MPTVRHCWPLLLLVLAVTGCRTAPTGAAQDFVAAADALAQAEFGLF